ncbi:MAG: TIGR00730 family Rossman fold protein [Bacteroidetes bacterium]|nr:MAG: TIGR00730 family Rossman fold protein [Bacteroidota bacterium]
MIKTICVYCSSSDRIDQVYFKAAEELAKILVEKKIIVVFGGGSSGLMGRIADTVIKMNGEIIGIMPNFMKAIEWDHKGVYNFHFVEDMHARKKKFIDSSDALITLPGGSGTFEELLEAITLKRLGLHDLPIIILNTNAYFDPLIEMLNRAVEQQFLRPEDDKLWDVIVEPEEIEFYL